MFSLSVHYRRHVVLDRIMLIVSSFFNVRSFPLELEIDKKEGKYPAYMSQMGSKWFCS